MALGQFILAQCYDLAKWLSHYLIFLFLFFSFLLLLRWSTGKYYVTSHRVTKKKV